MIHTRKSACERLNFTIRKKKKDIARASVIFITNELHKTGAGRHIPYALLEDVFVEEQYRGKGLATDLICRAIESAREKKCYKLIAIVDDSKPHLERLYEQAGLVKNNSEFRIDLHGSE